MIVPSEPAFPKPIMFLTLLFLVEWLLKSRRKCVSAVLPKQRRSLPAGQDGQHSNCSDFDQQPFVLTDSTLSQPALPQRQSYVQNANGNKPVSESGPLSLPSDRALRSRENIPSISIERLVSSLFRTWDTIHGYDIHASSIHTCRQPLIDSGRAKKRKPSFAGIASFPNNPFFSRVYACFLLIPAPIIAVRTWLCVFLHMNTAYVLVPAGDRPSTSTLD